MPFRFDVEMLDASLYPITRLLGKGESNTKTAKSDAASDEYLTYSLSLAPASVSGFNVCSSSSHGCRMGCLYTSGRAGMFRSIKPARIAKTRFYKLHKSTFVDRLMIELGSAERRATKLGKRLAVRLNVLSDVQWEREVPSIFSRFSDVTFYDYTKHANRMMRFLAGDFPSNYHLTFSRSETNENETLDVLRSGGNVAIPFAVRRTGNLPVSYKGYDVINGDLTDLRFLDPKNVVVGLRAKGQAKSDTSGFVVPQNQIYLIGGAA